MATNTGELNLTLPDDQLQEVAEKAKDFAVSQGVTMRTKEQPNSSEVLNYAPFTLFPSPIPRSCYQEAVDVQKAFNELMFLVSQDYDFLHESLKSVLDGDDFIKHLWDIYTTVRNEKSGQPITIQLNRSDYMVDMKDPSHPQIKQIEFNTFAASFSGLASQLINVHRYTLDLCGKTNYESRLPLNDASTGLAHGLVSAWNQYGNQNAAIMFCIETESRNIFDQRWIEFKIHAENRRIRVIRRMFSEVSSRGQLTADNKLIVDGIEIAVVYFRCGYIPAHYPTEKEWQALLTMERSKAIKCPPVQSHLAGCKKIQQVLAQPGMVERFIKDPVAVQKIRKTFAGLYTLDQNADGDKAVAMAMKDPEKFVMKPQREGGGNNFYGADIVPKLSAIKDTTERGSYILMERIFPPTNSNCLLRCGGEVVVSSVLNELGIFGTLLGNGSKILENRFCGHLLRTKTVGTDEGGVSAGFSGIDTPYLSD